MFPLNSSALPQTKDELQNLLTHGIAQLLRVPTGSYPFKMEGELPDLQKLEVDLDGAVADPTLRVPVPEWQTPEQHAWKAAEFTMHAKPVRVATTPVQVLVQATQMSFSYRQDTRGHYWVLPATEQDARNGMVQVSMRQDQLSELFMSVVAPLAKGYGVSIEDAHVALEQIGPRSLRARIDATGKKFVMRAKLRVMGQVDVDDQLNATVSNLQAGGDGFLGGIVSNLLEPQMAKVNGSKFPLAGLGLGSLQLRDLQLTVAEEVTVRAAFGEA